MGYVGDLTKIIADDESNNRKVEVIVLISSNFFTGLMHFLWDYLAYTNSTLIE